MKTLSSPLREMASSPPPQPAGSTLPSLQHGIRIGSHANMSRFWASATLSSQLRDSTAIFLHISSRLRRFVVARQVNHIDLRFPADCGLKPFSQRCDASRLRATRHWETCLEQMSMFGGRRRGNANQAAHDTAVGWKSFPQWAVKTPVAGWKSFRSGAEEGIRSGMARPPQPAGNDAAVGWK